MMRSAEKRNWKKYTAGRRLAAIFSDGNGNRL
jgi:hypothetical protein